MMGLDYVPDGAEKVYSPLWYHLAGRSQTATGYGSKLTTPWKVWFNGRYYRVYRTQWSNLGTHWIESRGTRYIVRL